MQILAIRCRTFEYTVTAASPCATDLVRSAIGVTRPFFDCLLLIVGVERGDRGLAPAALRVVRQMIKETDANYVVINGFAHAIEKTSDDHGAARIDLLGHLGIAMDVLCELVERLEERGEQVHLMPFGTSRSWYIDAPGGVVQRRTIRLSPTIGRIASSDGKGCRSRRGALVRR